MRYLGIDPGKGGGLALLTAKGKIVEIAPWQDLAIFIAYMRALDSKDTMIFIEASQSRFGNSMQSVATYMYHSGSLEGVVTTLGMPFEKVPSQTWWRTMHAGAPATLKPKERSKIVVERLFPGEDLTNPLVSSRPNNTRKAIHEGIMDALLIAEYGRRKYLGFDSKVYNAS